MKHTYGTPRLVEYGRLEKLTLGQHGTQPDFNNNSGQFVNDNCLPSNSGPGQSGNSNPFTCGGPNGTPAMGS